MHEESVVERRATADALDSFLRSKMKLMRNRRKPPAPAGVHAEKKEPKLGEDRGQDCRNLPAAATSLQLLITLQKPDTHVLKILFHNLLFSVRYCFIYFMFQLVRMLKH